MEILGYEVGDWCSFCDRPATHVVAVAIGAGVGPRCAAQRQLAERHFMPRLVIGCCEVHEEQVGVEVARRLGVSESWLVPETQRKSDECPDCDVAPNVTHQPAYDSNLVGVGVELFEVLSQLAWGNDPDLEPLVCAECGERWPCESALSRHS